jgi:hypothetical protein
MRIMSLLLTALFLLPSTTWADEGHHHALTEEEVGSVQFSTSCSPTVATSFNRAVALLHSFQYEKTRAGFSGVAQQDPGCAMAYWGIAMSHYHGLWDSGDSLAGRSAIQKAQQLAVSNSRTTLREKSYIEALAEIYKEDGRDKTTHARAFEQKMGQLQSAFPADSEAAVLHALSLAITAPKTDKTFANQRRCGEILEPILAKQPHHPGVAHYLIHCYDNPVLAEKGVRAARLYAEIAPASAHANHMPSHIFTRVGSWEESIHSNQRSEELAAADEATSQNGEARDQRLHAMDYLEYAYLQSGRVARAKSVVDEMKALKSVPGLTLTGDYANAAIPARYALERRVWGEASALESSGEGVPWAQAITWTAIGIGSARTGKRDRASQAEHRLASLRDAAASRDPYWADQIEVQRREVAAWIAENHGTGPESVSLMRSAAELEESMDKNAVTPGAVIPAREMLGELLLLHNSPQESLAEYRSVLKVAPNRFNGLYGAANAAEAAGDAVVANEFLRKLTAIAVGDERPELVAARKKLAATAESINH